MKVKFEKLSGKDVKIGIIDTGINYRNFNNIVDAYKCNYKDYIDYIGHGTMVAQIINKLAPSSKLYNIKVFDRNSYTKPKMIIKGIEWCIENNLDIINLSLGTKDFFFYEHFRTIINKAKKKRCTIVSAISNDYSFSLPAILDNVICVGSSNNHINDKYGYYFVRNKYIQCIADGGQFGNTFFEDVISRKSHTSYAAPIISSIVSLLLQLDKRLDYHQLLEILEQNSLKNKPNLDYVFSKIKNDTLLVKNDTDLLENKIINNSKKIFYFPIIKEKHFFYEYTDLMSVEISNCEKNNSLNDDYDLFIISKSILSVDNEKLELLNKHLSNAINKGKSIYSLVPRKELSTIILTNKIEKYHKISFINDYTESFKNNTIQITPNNKTPILSFIDMTNDKFDNFDIQLLIRRYFLFKKIDFIQISSIIYSPLFGFDFVLNCELLKNELLLSDFVPFISYLNHFFTSKKNKELVFYSFDTTPFLSTDDVIDAKKNSLATFTFSCLNTIQPDSFILNIDFNCNLEFLRKNIDSILYNYNPDFIILLMNTIFSYESDLNNIKSIYNLIKSKYNSSVCEIFILDMTEENFENKILRTLIKHYN